MRRWGPITTLITGSMLKMKGAATVGNPTAVWDSHTKVIWLLLCANLGCDTEWAIHARRSTASRSVWVTSSSDLGKVRRQTSADLNLGQTEPGQLYPRRGRAGRRP